MRALWTSRGLWRILLLALACSGCGYQAGLSIAPDYSTLGVEIFGRDGRDAPVRNLERELHEELVRSATNLVDAELQRPSEAQLVMRGTIASYRRRDGIRNSKNQLLETGIQVIVRAELWDRMTETLVSGPISASTWVGYTLDAQDAELKARKRLLRNLSDRIVLELITDLGTQPRSGAEQTPPADSRQPLGVDS